MTPPTAPDEDRDPSAPERPLARLVAAVRDDPVRSASIVVAVLLAARVLVDPGSRRALAEWARFAYHAATVTVELVAVDPGPTLLVTAAFLAKLLLALAPTVVLIASAPRWRVAGLVVAAGVLIASVALTRAGATALEWVLALAASALGAWLARRPYLRAGVALPLVVLLALPALAHGAPWHRGEALAPRCAENDGERPRGVAPRLFGPRYYGVHPVGGGWVLLTGETERDGRFLGVSHGGSGSFWFRDQDGELALHGPSAVTGNIWTSCRLGEDAWLTRAGRLVRFRPPSDDGAAETVEHFEYDLIGFDAPDVACDAERGLVLASDLFDGRPVELSVPPEGPPRRRRDEVGARGGALAMRPSDGRLLAMDFQRLSVVDLDTSRVLARAPVAAASQSLALCPSDGAVAVPDLAGRLRVYRQTDEGGYAFDWGLDLFAPRLADFSPDCAHLAVTSADDTRVWIVERASRRVIRELEVGPGLRGGAFIGPRRFAVADACTVTTLRF